MKNGISKRGKAWGYQVRITDPKTGKSKQVSKGGFATRGEAVRARDEARSTGHRGQHVDRAATTVQQFLETWLVGHALHVKPTTHANYTYSFRHYVYPQIGGTRIQALAARDILAMYATLAQTGGRDGGTLGHATIEAVHRHLRKALNDAVRVDRIIPTNPAEHIKPPRRDTRPRPTDVWDGQQVHAFLEGATTHRLAALFHVAAGTGMRRGELLALRWHDVDLAGATITVRRNTGVVNGERVEGTPKNGDERVVSIDPDTVAALRAHHRRQTVRVLADDGGYVFATEHGEPLYPDTPTALFTKLTARAGAGLPHIPFHGLRHTHATILLQNGVPVHVVAERLGHRDPGVTVRVYAHVLREQATGVAEVWAKAVASG